MFRTKALTTVALVVGTTSAVPQPSCQNNVTVHCEYDYVIVGAGASGLTVANRLSEDRNVSVLIIEAGDFDKNEDFVTIPALAGGAVGTQYDWNISYAATPSVNGRNVPLPQGKVVGGSTKLNRMNFNRGSKSDYDGWEALGNEGWGWEALLPYFKKVRYRIRASGCGCNMANIRRTRTSPLRSKILSGNTMSPMIWSFMAQKATCNLPILRSSGPLSVRFTEMLEDQELTIVAENVVGATKELGIPMSYDQAGDPIGAYYCPHNQDPITQTRSSAREAYYETAKGRSNFELITGRRVTRLVTSMESGKACVTGVEVSLIYEPCRSSRNGKARVERSL